MASTTETGHSKNVFIFQELVGACASFKTDYNPPRAELSLTALNIQLTHADAMLQMVKITKANCDTAIIARKILFKSIRPLSTKIINSLRAAGVNKQTIDDARESNVKIQGKRATRIKRPTEAALAAGVVPTKTISVSQQSYDMLTDHFHQLVLTLTSIPTYQPNENELKISTLTALHEDMKAKNSAVIIATSAASNARIARDQALYAEGTGIATIAQSIKAYVKSVFGATSPQYKQVNSLRFTKRPNI